MSRRPISKVTKKKAGTARKTPSVRAIQEFIDLMDARGLVELSWKKGDQELSLRMAGPSGHSPYDQRYAYDQGAHVYRAEPSAVATPTAEQPVIRSPFVGTFYQSPSPDAPPYVREGQSVQVGDVLCIVEAMKLMNEIQADRSGRIVRILAQNGQPVQFGESLFLLEA